MKYNWGIIGTGNIANQMAIALNSVKEANLISVLSRSEQNARKFAKRYKLQDYASNIDSFLLNDKIDIVYIATPHPNHYSETLKCLEYNKHVLCEKPIAMNSVQSNEMYRKAIEKHVLLMEAMWTLCFPAIKKIKELIMDGEIGKIKYVEAKFCFKTRGNKNGRHLNKALGGGALLDVGVYPIYFAQTLLNDYPHEIHSLADIGKTGVDELSSYYLKYENGAIANLTSSVKTRAAQNALVCGTRGYIEVPMFWNPNRFTLYKKDEKKTFKFKRLGNGYSYEVLEVHNCLKKGQLESKLVPHNLSREVMLIMDELRKQWGLVYEADK